MHVIVLPLASASVAPNDGVEVREVSMSGGFKPSDEE